MYQWIIRVLDPFDHDQHGQLAIIQAKSHWRATSWCKRGNLCASGGGHRRPGWRIRGGRKWRCLVQVSHQTGDLRPIIMSPRPDNLYRLTVCSWSSQSARKKLTGSGNVGKARSNTFVVSVAAQTQSWFHLGEHIYANVGPDASSADRWLAAWTCHGVDIVSTIEAAFQHFLTHLTSAYWTWAKYSLQIVDKHMGLLFAPGRGVLVFAPCCLHNHEQV